MSMNYRGNIAANIPSAIVVTFVAIPLNLGIALASGAPLFSGLLAGILGGIITGSLSASPLAVTGPAAGLAGIVLMLIRDLGTYQAFLTALVVAGGIQVLLGIIRAGVIGHFIPSAVVKGMLAGIGIIFILKQIPHAFGDDADFVGDEDFFQSDKENTLTEIWKAIVDFSPTAVIISVACLALLLILRMPAVKKKKWITFLPSPMLAVALGIFINWIVGFISPQLVLEGNHLVTLPELASWSSLFVFPDWGVLTKNSTYIAAVTLALVASIETLLAIEAADKMDPFRRITPLNRELKAQGVTNVISGLLGGLPVTAVIARTSANVVAGAESKMSTILHGIILAVSVMLFPTMLHKIPLASLSIILILIGYRLISPEMWKELWKKGNDQFWPFAITVVGIVFTNLLLGVFIGALVSVFFVLRSNFQSAMLRVNNGNSYLIKFTKDVSFFNKSTLVKSLETIPNNSSLLFEGSSVRFFDNDVIEVISDFTKSAPTRNITVSVKKTRHALHPFFKSEE
jgi:MFS superfamily sulfate permease-like transporter